VTSHPAAGTCRRRVPISPDGIDQAHRDVVDELTSLLEWTAAIEAGGALLSLVSFGGAEVGAQGVEAARVAVTAGRVGKIIQTLIDLAGTLARAVSSVFSKIGKVAQRLLRIERAEVSEATVSAAAKTPEVAETSEATAVAELETSAEASAASERAALEYATREDKLGHVFVPKHKLEPLVEKFGSREAVMEQVIKSITDLVPKAGKFEVTCNIGGQAVVVRGAVVDGVPKIGTAFTP
jgi:hypothetical protein